MERITLHTVEHEIQNLLEHKPLNCDNLERYILLARARKYLMSESGNGFTEDDARTWAEKMHPPARWTMDQTTAVMKQYGFSHRPCEFYAVMNSLYSDYGAVLGRYNADRLEVWAGMADAWISDEDAQHDKAGLYFKYIVKH